MCQLVLALRLLATEHSVAVVVSMQWIYPAMITVVTADQQHGVRRRGKSETSFGSDLVFCP